MNALDDILMEIKTPISLIPKEEFLMKISNSSCRSGKESIKVWKAKGQKKP